MIALPGAGAPNPGGEPHGVAAVFRRWAAQARVGEAEALELLLSGVSSRRGPGAVVLGVPRASPE